MSKMDVNRCQLKGSSSSGSSFKTEPPLKTKFCNNKSFVYFLTRGRAPWPALFTFGLVMQWAAVIACLVEIKAAPQDGMTPFCWSIHKPSIQGYGLFSQLTLKALRIWLDLDVIEDETFKVVFRPHLSSMSVEIKDVIRDLFLRFLRNDSICCSRSVLQGNLRQQATSVSLGHLPRKIPLEVKQVSGWVQTPWSLLGLMHWVTTALFTSWKIKIKIRNFSVAPFIFSTFVGKLQLSQYFAQRLSWYSQNLSNITFKFRPSVPGTPWAMIMKLCMRNQHFTWKISKEFFFREIENK